MLGWELGRGCPPSRPPHAHDNRCGSLQLISQRITPDATEESRDSATDRDIRPAESVIEQFWLPVQIGVSLKAEAGSCKVRQLISELGKRAKGSCRVYLVGGSSIVLLGTGRISTIDVDLKLDPEPPGVFEAIAEIKESLDVNVELASPDQFIPELPNWRDRSQFIDVVGKVEFFHYDFYSQALAKLERGHDRDIDDVKFLIREGLVDRENYWTCSN